MYHIYIYICNMAVSRLFLYPLSSCTCKHTSFPLERLVLNKVEGILQWIGPG